MNRVTKINLLEKKEGQKRTHNKFLYVPLLISLTIAPSICLISGCNNNNQDKKEHSSVVNAQQPLKGLKGKMNEILGESSVNFSQKTIDTVARCLQRYENSPTVKDEYIIWMLGEIFENTNSEKAVSNVVNCVSKYEKCPEVAQQFALKFDLDSGFTIAEYTRYPQLAGDFWLIRSASERRPWEAKTEEDYSGIKGKIEYWLVRTAAEIKNRGEISHMSKLLSLDSVVNCILKYEKYPNAAREIASSFELLASETGSKKEMSDAAGRLSSDSVFNCISKYGKDPEAANYIGYCLGDISRLTKSEEEVLIAVKRISKAKTPKEAVIIARKLT